MSPNSSNRLYMNIKQDIINLDLKPGERLPERDLAEKYNVSRTPVRQALQKLAIEGLVEFIPYKGAFIKEITIEEFKDITELRMVLEQYAVEICCETENKEIMQEIEHIIEQQKVAAANNDVREYSMLDQEFHYLMVKGSNNKELKEFFKILNHRSYLSRIRTLMLPGQMERSIKDHEEILKWIIKGDKEKAGKAAASHVGEALQTYLNVHDIMMTQASHDLKG